MNEIPCKAVDLREEKNGLCRLALKIYLGMYARGD